ncbi:MAG: 3-deoxy-D-manno-octulosonic acid transferase [Bacteroidaceae bacterium]|nr:3-deoxy-D-manno-octulosonic acid transferase [Bacteroidaceae bacterium]
MIYSLGIYLYAGCINIVSLFNRKARLLIQGHRNIFKTLKEQVDPKSSYLWFHASSLGEFEQGRPLIERIHNKHPECRILLTFFSPSGYEVRKNYKGADIVCYIPFDTPHNVRKFLDSVKIEKAFFIKYEFWPNFLRGLYKRNIEIFSISSIFRDNQLFFKWYGRRYAKALTYFKHLFVQDRHSKDLLYSIGITDVSIVGDTRADRVIEVAADSKQFPIIEKFVNGNPTFIAGSSWPADEELFIPYFLTKRNWKLIIAPHEIHEEHLAEIEGRLNGRDCIRLSKATMENIKGYDTLIIDCFGMLSSIYRYGHIAYIGGGFGVGIHNILEAAVFDIPVLFGPNNKRFREAQDMKRLKGGFEITDAYSFRILIDKFISDPGFLKKAGKNAGDYVRSSSGTSDLILGEIGLD